MEQIVAFELDRGAGGAQRFVDGVHHALYVEVVGAGQYEGVLARCLQILRRCADRCLDAFRKSAGRTATAHGVQQGRGHLAVLRRLDHGAVIGV